MQKTIAVLLAAVLVVGMVSNEAPITVLADETDGQQESVRGDDMEMSTEGTELAEQTNSEGQKENVTQEQDGVTQQTPDGAAGQETPGTGTEEAMEPETVTDGENVNFYDVMLVNEVRTAGADTGYEVTYRLSDMIPRDHYDMDISLSASKDVQFHYTKLYGQANYVIPTEVIEAGVIKCVCNITSGSVESLALKLLYADAEKDRVEYGANTISVGDGGSDGLKYIGFMNLVNGENDISIDSITFTVSKNVSADKYTVTVNGGTGGDEYEAGATVTIMANAAVRGKQFDKWVVSGGNVTLVDATSSITTFTMPAGAVTVTATYKDSASDADNIADGDGWMLDMDGKLTISSDTGMEGWIANGRNNHSSKVTGAEIHGDVTRIPGAAFNGCSGLKNITISESVTSIGPWAFTDCSSLTEITIPSKVGEIGNAAFGRCSSLKTAIMLCETPPPIGTDVFTGSNFVANKAQGIYVPAGKAQTYKDAWTEWADYITDDAAPAEEHEHDNDNITFTAWTATDSLPTDAGNYYLTQDVTLSGTWNVPSGETTLCLNGKTISGASGGYRVIKIAATDILNLYDCQNKGKITGGAGGIEIEKDGTFHMYGGKISDNDEATYGGGVYNNGSFQMYGGEISGNSASYRGGGVHAAGDTFIMYGGKISGNSAKVSGGGISVEGTVIVGGEAIVSGNTRIEKENNVYLSRKKTITIDNDNPLSGSAKIGITTASLPNADNPVNITGTNGTDYSSYFTSDNERYVIANGTDNVVQLTIVPVEKHEHNGVTFTAWTATDSLPTSVGGEYYLTENVTLSGIWKVQLGEMNLCLNGKTISLSPGGQGSVIEIEQGATLNLYDCQNDGKITGGKMCGIHNNGTFHMYGGKISGNGNNNEFGGVFNGGTFHMYGGEISGNSNATSGGGVFNGGTFQMYGGKISGNTASGLGGGVYNNNGTFTVGGDAVISSNTCNGTENNVYLGDGQTITVDSSTPPSGSAKIGVTTHTVPTADNPINITGHNKGDYSSYFQSDNPDYEIVNADDYVQLAVKPQVHTHNLTLTPAKTATCTEDGNTAYYTCAGCDQWFSDENGTQEIADKDSVVLPKTGHSYDNSEWGYREADGHARKCRSCDAHDTVQRHTEDAGTVTKAPTQETTGEKTYRCSECGYVMRMEEVEKLPPTHEHTYGVDWKTDADSHWHECTGCGDKKDLAAHIEDKGTVTKAPTQETTGEKTYRCSECGYVMRTEEIGKLPPEHIHTWSKTWSNNTTHHWHACTVDGCPITENADKDGYAAHTEDSGTVTTPPTQETTGEKTYRCSECGYVMRTEEVEKLPPTHEHTYGVDWKTDADSHWHECTDCGDKKDFAAHTPDDGTITKEPTKNETGIKTYKCSVCGYTMRTETLPATGGGGDKPGGGDDKPGTGKGEISQEIQKGENAPDTKIPIPEKELGDFVLTPEDKEETEKGSDIKILLTVTDAQNSVSDDDKKTVSKALNGYKVGQYLDISLFKVIGANRDKVTETAGKVRIVITVPDTLKSMNTKKTRTFGVIRVHNGRAAFLTDTDSDENTITIETDRFSTYAIVYKDTNKKGSGGGGGSSHKNDSTDSSSNSASTASAAPANAANAAVNPNTANAYNTADILNAANALNNEITVDTAATADQTANRNGRGKDDEPKTGDCPRIELYATLAMISALSYFALYFKERKRGITEAEKKAFTGKLVQWARQGGRLRKLIAIMIAFVYLSYYHSIGKQVAFAWEEVT